MATIKSLKITKGQWENLFQYLIKNYPASYVLIREKSKEKLGFVYREHERWEEYINYNNQVRRRHIIEFFLDFYDERKKTMFLLKYGEFLK